MNWLVKPFSMAALGWLCVQGLFGSVLGWIDPETARNYTAGLIILAAAPCTAMVFVWSYLTDGDAHYTLAQVAINDRHHGLRIRADRDVSRGVSGVHIPGEVLFVSVLVFIVIPLAAGAASRVALIRRGAWSGSSRCSCRGFRPVTIVALLATLVLIFAFQAENLVRNWVAVLLLAVPILIQVYFNAGLTYALMRRFGVRHDVATPAR